MSHLDTLRAQANAYKMKFDNRLFNKPFDVGSIQIPKDEVPILITETGEILCLPLNVHDEPSIAVVGRKGGGKSYLCHRIIDMFYWYGNRRVGIINDSLDETLCWNRANSFQMDKLAIIGSRPRGLPVIHLYPASCDLNKDDLPNKDCLLMSLPFKDFLNNSEQYGVLSTKSMAYLIAIQDELLKCKTEEEVIDVIDREYNVKQKNISLGNKMKVEMSKWFKYKCLDINAQESVSRLKIFRKNDIVGKIYYPANGILYADAIFSIHTRDLLNRPYYSNYMAFIMEEIFSAQKNDKYFSENNIRVLLFVDEVTAISGTENKGRADEALTKIVTRGRPNNIASMIATQNWTKVNKVIRSNTTYMFITNLVAKKEVKEIQADFDLSDMDADSIFNLGKFEVMAKTNEHFVLYDPESGMRRECKGPIIGKAIPTLSLHQAPKSQNEKEQKWTG